jgi:hypothetical protein
VDSDGPLTASGFTPRDEDVRELMGWFERYDALVRDGRTQEMADMALFPIVVMTNDSAGECVTQEWDRETFVRAMGMSEGGTDPSGVEIVNERQPFFLGHDLAVVVTNSVVTTDGRTRHMRYADIMARRAGGWRFKSMIQAGWGDMLKEYLGA